MPNWRPTASLNNLQMRAHALNKVRDFFAKHRVLEVETPLLGLHTVTDPNIDSFKLAQHRYLQTSPEYAMKRLLAAGVPDIYQICKCFRQAEQGNTHNPEFTMIEWYRLGFSLEQIMQETVQLIAEVVGSVIQDKKVEYISYDDAYKKALGISFFELTENDVNQLSIDHGLQVDASMSTAQKIDFVFSQLVMSKLDQHAITCVYHYPAQQAALAQLNAKDSLVADRFEVFCAGLELANGYVELLDSHTQLARFEADQQVRASQGLPDIDIDQRLLDAQKHGLPDCAGVAVGLDRLLMLALGAKNIEQVMSFSWKNA